MITVATQHKHNKAYTTYVYGSEALLAEGVQKVFSTYFATAADGKPVKYCFIFATEAELLAAVKTVRSQFKAAGGSIRKANLFHGAWDCAISADNVRM